MVLRVESFAVCVSLLPCFLCMALPEYISQCSRNDPNLNECALKSAKESIHNFSLGDQARGMRSLDPVIIPEMTIYVPNENGLKVRFLDNHFFGLSMMDMKTLKFDLDKKVITTDTLVNLDIKGSYDLSGKLLIVPIKCNGDSLIKLKKTMLHIRFWYENVEGDDGKTHWKIYKQDIKYEVEKASFKLDNLLGDKSIGDQINKLLNEMWKEIVLELGPAISKGLLDAVVLNLQILLDQVSYDEMMPE